MNGEYNLPIEKYCVGLSIMASFIKFTMGNYLQIILFQHHIQNQISAENTPAGKNVTFSLNIAIQKNLSKLSSVQLDNDSLLSISQSILYELFSSIKLELLNRLNKSLMK